MSALVIPFATAELIPPDANDPVINPRIGILHVDAGNSPDLHDLFLRNQQSGGSKIESHLHIRKDGHLFQYRDLLHQADANRDANDFAISVETQGLGEGEWTDEQISCIKRIMLFCRSHQRLMIPLRVVQTWDDPKGGWGYHTFFGAPSHWTPVAKSCPGPKRKEQFHDILVPWMKSVDWPATGGTKLNNVEHWRDEQRMALNRMARANRDIQIPADRKAARAMEEKMAAVIAEGREILEKGPKS